MAGVFAVGLVNFRGAFTMAEGPLFLPDGLVLDCCLSGFPLLQIYNPEQVPQLPTGYSLLKALAMIPPVWRRVFNPKVRAWRCRFCPEIQDWTPYKQTTLPERKSS